LPAVTSAFIALLPVFIVILLGFALRRSALMAADQWVALDRICYFVLFPAIIFKEIAAADFTGVPVARMALAMMLSVTVMFAALLAARKPLCSALRIDGPQFTSLFQGASRWHTFIAFAIIPLYFGPKALSLGAVSAAAMTPLLNIVCVIVMSRYATAGNPGVRIMVLSILRNPFVLSSLGGIAWQLLGLPLPAIGVQVLDMIGRGALGLALLTVGAGLRIDDAISAWPPVAAATLLKLLVMPVFMVASLKLLGVTGEAFSVALLCGAVPTGSGAYVLARQMGGDAGLVANILTAQVVAAAITIPLILGWFA
jgi:malonate transporter and related proteins